MDNPEPAKPEESEVTSQHVAWAALEMLYTLIGSLIANKTLTAVEAIGSAEVAAIHLENTNVLPEEFRRVAARAVRGAFVNPEFLALEKRHAQSVTPPSPDPTDTSAVAKH